METYVFFTPCTFIILQIIRVGMAQVKFASLCISLQSSSSSSSCSTAYTNHLCACRSCPHSIHSHNLHTHYISSHVALRFASRQYLSGRAFAASIAGGTRAAYTHTHTPDRIRCACAWESRVLRISAHIGLSVLRGYIITSYTSVHHQHDAATSPATLDWRSAAVLRCHSHRSGAGRSQLHAVQEERQPQVRAGPGGRFVHCHSVDGVRGKCGAARRHRIAGGRRQVLQRRVQAGLPEAPAEEAAAAHRGSGVGSGGGGW